MGQPKIRGARVFFGRQGLSLLSKVQSKPRISLYIFAGWSWHWCFMVNFLLTLFKYNIGDMPASIGVVVIKNVLSVILNNTCIWYLILDCTTNTVNSWYEKQWKRKKETPTRKENRLPKITHCCFKYLSFVFAEIAKGLRTSWLMAGWGKNSK